MAPCPSIKPWEAARADTVSSRRTAVRRREGSTCIDACAFLESVCRLTQGAQALHRRPVPEVNLSALSLREEVTALHRTDIENSFSLTGRTVNFDAVKRRSLPRGANPKQGR